MKVNYIPKIPSKHLKKRVCAYARVSTDNSNQEESMETQVKRYEKLISANPEYEFIGVFADKGITGTKEDRLGFQKMLQQCNQGKIDLILTKSISRFARNTTLVLKTIRDLKEIGVEVLFENENIRTMSGDGELMLAVLSSIAEEESRSASENVKWRIKKKFEESEVIINTKRFLGYDKNKDGELVINEEQAVIVRRIYEEYLKGNGALKIAKILNETDYKTITGAKWSNSSILEILKNEKYKGDVLLQKTYRENHLTKKKMRNKGERDSYYIEENHPAIIDRYTWEQVQTEMKNRTKNTDIEKYQNRYELSGKLFCSKCGATLKRRTWNSKASCKKVVWQCSTYINKGKSYCTGTVIADEIISKVKIDGLIIVEERIENGKKNYIYSNKDW